MRILITNDDGIQAPGLRALAASLQGVHEVFVVAPLAERSGAGHAITLGRPFRIGEARVEGLDCAGWWVDGTPADCAKAGLKYLVGPVDAVLSGINLGANVGTDALYSGTVNAAMEAAMMGYPAVALSIPWTDRSPVFDAAVTIAPRALEWARALPRDCMLNVNCPGRAAVRGIRVAPPQILDYTDGYEELTGPQGERQLQLRGMAAIPEHPEGDTDSHTLYAGYVAVTPLRFVAGHGEAMTALQRMIEEEK